MNFFDVEVADGRLVGHGFAFDVPQRMSGRIRDDRHLTLGVRPEHMHEAGPGEDSMPLVVDVLEPLGAEVHALGDVEGQPVTAELSPDTAAAVGDVVPVGIDLEEVHLFEREGGRSLLSRAPSPASVAG